MCLNISNEDASKTDFMWGSLTGHFVTKVNAFRNDAEDPKTSALEMLGRRVVAGLGYAALSVASLVEMVARVALSLLLLLPCAVFAYFSDEGAIEAAPAHNEDNSNVDVDKGNMALFPLVFGAQALVFGPEVSIRCLSAFVQNCYRGEIQYEDLPPCGTCPSESDMIADET